MGLRQWLFGERPKPATDPVGAGIHLYYPLWLNDQDAAPNPDDLVGRLGIATYREMLADDQVASCVALIQHAILSAPLEITPAGDDPVDEEIADFCREQFDYLDGQTRDDVLGFLLEALYMGFSCVEKIYREDPVWTGKISIRRFVPMPQETILFKVTRAGEIEPDGVWQAKQERHYLTTGMTDPAHYDHHPREKFVVWQWQQRYGLPYGQSLLRGAYRWWMLKKQAVQWWARYIETFGTPWVTATIAPGQSKEEALEQLKRLKYSGMAAMPAAMKVELTSAFGSASNANYEAFISYCDKAMGRALLNPSLLMDNTSTGSRALGGTHQDSFLWFVDSARRSLAAKIRSDVLEPLVRLNWGEAYECPNVGFAETDAGRLNTLLERMGGAQKLGLSIGSNWARRNLGIPEPEENEEELRSGGGALVDPLNGGMNEDEEDQEPGDRDVRRGGVAAVLGGGPNRNGVGIRG